MADDFGPNIPGRHELPKDSSYLVLLAERGLTAVPKAQGPPANLHTVRQARSDVSGLPEFRAHRRNDI